MNIYDIMVIENQIEKAAAENDGELTDEQLQALVEAQTTSIVQIEKLCQYIRHLDLGAQACKTEEERIKSMREKAERRIEGIKKYLTPYVQTHGRVETPTFALSIRKSQRLNIVKADFQDTCDKKYIVVVPESYRIDKDAVKKDMKSGVDVPGAVLEGHYNLQIK